METTRLSIERYSVLITFVFLLIILIVQMAMFREMRRFHSECQSMETSQAHTMDNWFEPLLMDQRTTRTQTQSTLGPNYEVIEDIGVYKFHLDWKTWNEARRICEDEGTQLAILDHYQEYAVLREKAMVRLQGHDPYIGVYRNGTQGNWTTILGKPLDHKDYLGWSPGYPKGEGDCARLRIGIRQGIVNGLCNVKRPFLCEVH
ncbi:hemolymph lipopolysaccharide-binding protein isoform X2 [Anabrus simplex]